MTNELIKSRIKGREVVYYLTTEDDLKQIKTTSIFGEIFVLLFSVSIGGIISVVLARAASDLNSELLRLLDLMNIIFIILSILFGLLVSYFFVASFGTISKIKGSGELKSFSAPEQNINHGLEITKALFYTSNKSQDITEQMVSLVSNNTLNTKAKIAIFGDPDPNTHKKLKIEYVFNGIHFLKEYGEDDNIQLP